MKTIILSVVSVAVVFLPRPIHAESRNETCRSYVVDVSADKKYCLFDADEKIAEIDWWMETEKKAREINDPKNNTLGPFPERPTKQMENP